MLTLGLSGFEARINLCASRREALAYILFKQAASTCLSANIYNSEVEDVLCAEMMFSAVSKSYP